MVIRLVLVAHHKQTRISRAYYTGLDVGIRSIIVSSLFFLGDATVGCMLVGGCWHAIGHRGTTYKVFAGDIRARKS